MKYTAIIEGERVDIELRTSHGGIIEASIGDQKYVIDAALIEPGVYWFNWNNRSLELSVAAANDHYTVSFQDHQVGIEILDARAALRKASQHGQAGTVELRAPMPGKIVKVLLGEGAEVRTNQGIVVMEAMKMQNEIKSPKNGVVKRVVVNETAAVNAGDLLVVVE